jgi:hypothetical protein
MKAEIKQKLDAAIAQLRAEGINPEIVCEDRDQEHNARVGGAKQSQHLVGTAIDFNIASLTDAQKERMLEVFEEYGAHGFGVYTRGDEFTGALHIDFRDGPITIWGKNGSYHSYAGNWLPAWAAQALGNGTSNPDPSSNPLNSDVPQNDPSNSDEQNEETNPFMQFIVALLQALFPEHKTEIASLGNLPSQQLPNAKPRANTLG